MESKQTTSARRKRRKPLSVVGVIGSVVADFVRSHRRVRPKSSLCEMGPERARPPVPPPPLPRMLNALTIDGCVKAPTPAPQHLRQQLVPCCQWARDNIGLATVRDRSRSAAAITLRPIKHRLPPGRVKTVRRGRVVKGNCRVVRRKSTTRSHPFVGECGATRAPKADGFLVESGHGRSARLWSSRHRRNNSNGASDL